MLEPFSLARKPCSEPLSDGASETPTPRVYTKKSALATLLAPFGPRNTGLAIRAVKHWVGMELLENPGNSLPNVYIKKPRYLTSGGRKQTEKHRISISKIMQPITTRSAQQKLIFVCFP